MTSKQYLAETVSGNIATVSNPLGSPIKRMYDSEQSPVSKNLNHAYELADVVLELTQAIRKNPGHSTKLEAALRRAKKDLKAALSDFTKPKEIVPQKTTQDSHLGPL